jgi:hypothetical protein
VPVRRQVCVAVLALIMTGAAIAQLRAAE